MWDWLLLKLFDYNSSTQQLAGHWGPPPSRQQLLHPILLMTVDFPTSSRYFVSQIRFWIKYKISANPWRKMRWNYGRSFFPFVWVVALVLALMMTSSAIHRRNSSCHRYIRFRADGTTASFPPWCRPEKKKRIRVETSSSIAIENERLVLSPGEMLSFQKPAPAGETTANEIFPKLLQTRLPQQNTVHFHLDARRNFVKQFSHGE